jgi:hypothetical protein
VGCNQLGKTSIAGRKNMGRKGSAAFGKTETNEDLDCWVTFISSNMSSRRRSCEKYCLSVYCYNKTNIEIKLNVKARNKVLNSTNHGKRETVNKEIKLNVDTRNLKF